MAGGTPPLLFQTSRFRRGRSLRWSEGVRASLGRLLGNVDLSGLIKEGQREGRGGGGQREGEMRFMMT